MIQLPPEGIEGLTAGEIRTIVNFELPVDGTSLLQPLPPLDGTLTGVVLEGDGVTAVPDSEVRYRSDSPFFARLIGVRADSQGVYFVAATSAVNNGARRVVPRAGFTVDATHRFTRVVSPAYAGDFPSGGPSAAQDVVFVDTSAVEGTVRRAGGNVVSFGDVVLRAREQLINVLDPIAADGSFAFTGLPPELYSLVASQPHPQGSALRTAGSALVADGGQNVLADLTMPPTGGVEGTVSTGDGFPGIGVDVVLRGPDFLRFTASDTGGQYRLLDVPAGNYVLRVVEPITRIATVVPVTVLADQIAVRDLQLFGLGTMAITARIADGRPAVDAEVWVRVSLLGTGFLRAGRTDAAGELRIDDVPVGSFTVRVEHPENRFIIVEVDGFLAEGGGEIVVPVMLPVDQPPAIEMVLPVAGSVVPQGSLMTILAAAGDLVGVTRVDFFVDGVEVASDTTPPYRTVYRVTEVPGTELSVAAVAVDNGGQSVTAPAVVVTVAVDTVPPSISMEAPAEAIEGTELVLTAAAADDQGVARVEFRAGGTQVAVAEVAPYAAVFELDGDLASGGPVALALTATAFDFAGNSAGASRSLTVVEDRAPTIALVDAPASGSVFTAGEVVRFEAAATDDLDADVDLLVDGGVVQIRPSSPYRFDFTIPSPDDLVSPFEVVLRARDRQGQTASTAPILLEIVSDLPPSVAITAPADGEAAIEGEVVSVSATADDDLGVVSVAFTLDGVPIDELTEPPYQAQVRIPSGAPGGLTLRAVATDTTGQTGTATVTVLRQDDQVAPTVALTAPLDGAVVTAGSSDVVLLFDRTSSNGTSAGFDLDGDGFTDSKTDVQDAAAKALLELLDPTQSLVAVIEMSSSASLRQGLTNDFAAVEQAIDQLFSGSGSTGYEAALAAARGELSSPVARRTAKPVVILFSDGGSGGFPADEAVIVAGHDVVVHTVAVGIDADPTVLAQLAAATGGSASLVAAPEDLATVLTNVGQLGIAQLTAAAEAGDDVAVREVAFHAVGGLLDEILVDAEPPYLVTVPLPAFAGSTDVEITAEALDWGGNRTSTPPATVTVTPVDSTPDLFQIVPGGGIAGDLVILRGRYFSNVPLAHSVFFDGLPATVVTASKFELGVIVPLGVRTGPVTVLADGVITTGVLFQLDSDHDGLSDDDEAVFGTDPSDPDSDDDGLADGDEVHVHGTDPLAADSDGDGMADGYEVDRGFDPGDPADGALDPDADGLTNSGEFQAGSDPFDPDTDDDTLSDGDEVFVHGTDPTLLDTDGGGRNDAQEIGEGTDPLDPSDDLVQFPTTLVDGGGFPWYLDSGGVVLAGLNDAFRSPSFLPRVDGRLACCAEGAIPEDGGRELSLERRQVSTEEPQLFHSRKVFVPAADAFIRYLEIIDNESALAKEVAVRVDARVGTGVLTQLVALSTGAPTLTARDRWLITDDEDLSGSPAVAFIWAGATTRLLPSRLFTSAPGDDDFQSVFTFTVPAGERRILMHFGVQAIEQASAIARAEALSAGEAGALAGLAPVEQAQIVNFFAFPDADLDRLADADEAALGTDAFDPDSDGDGLRDGFEVEFGFDPLAFDDPDADPDGDGLSNFDEQDALGDPGDPDTDGDGLLDGDEVANGAEAALPDSDGDGLLDGEEVHLYGTDPADVDSDGGGLSDGEEVAQGSDPLDGSDDVFGIALPYLLVDGDGFEWNVQQDGAIRPGTDGAFGRGFIQVLDGQALPTSIWSQAALEDFGREIATSEIFFPIWRSRKIFVPADDGFVRYLETFRNPSSRDPRTIIVELRTFLGSGLETLIAGTSSGDQAFALDDAWIVTDDLDGFGSPAVAQVFHSPNGLVKPSAVATTAPGSNQVTVTYELTLPPRGRATLMHFGVQAFDRAAALAAADRLLRVGGSALDGLSQQERDEIVNFFPYPDTDFDRLSDEDEGLAGTDPDHPDSDGDGLTDGFEVLYGLDPLTFNADEDGDGLDNLDELELGTHPALPDTDGDRLLDGEEVLRTFTDPLVADTDLGGVEDGREELFDGTDPLDSADDLRVVRVADSAGVRPAVAVDGEGNLHLVWVDAFTGCGEVFYSMVTPAGAALIDDTQITGDCLAVEEPRVAVDAAGRVHVLWTDFFDVRYLALDPALDDRDGSPSTAATLVTVGPRILMPKPVEDTENCLPPLARIDPAKDFGLDRQLRFELAADGEGHAHVVWQSEFFGCEEPAGFDNQVHYFQLDSQGFEA
ncbi:MAG: Ig-like domain-containing protein, partial [Thermoanaerobaculia bacterium]